jgi:hypothetical protein
VSHRNPRQLTTSSEAAFQGEIDLFDLIRAYRAAKYLRMARPPIVFLQNTISHNLQDSIFTIMDNMPISSRKKDGNSVFGIYIAAIETILNDQLVTDLEDILIYHTAYGFKVLVQNNNFKTILEKFPRFAIAVMVQATVPQSLQVQPVGTAPIIERPVSAELRSVMLSPTPSNPDNTANRDAKSRPISHEKKLARISKKKKKRSQTYRSHRHSKSTHRKTRTEKK